MSFENPKSSDNKDGYCVDTLYALIERGPLQPENVPSKGALGDFLQKGFAVQIVVKGDNQFFAANNRGVELYLKHVGSDNLSEAVVKRKAAWARWRAECAIVVAAESSKKRVR